MPNRMNVPGSSLELMQEIQYRAADEGMELEIREEQLDALDAIRNNEDAGNVGSLVAMAPGVGKTVVMAADTRRRLLEDPTQQGLFLCDSNYILGEALQTFQTIVGREFTFGHFDRNFPNRQFSLLFDSFQAMRRHRQVFPRNAFKFGIVDESHHSKAPTYEPTLSYYGFMHLLGATATPDRHDELDIRDIFGPEVFKYPLEKAMAQRRLAAVDYHMITDPYVDGSIIDSKGHEYSRKDFNRVVFAPKRDKEMMRIAQEYAQRIKGPIKRAGFCDTIDQAEMFADLFSVNGDRTEAFHSRLSKKEQQRIYHEFKDETSDLSGIMTVAMFDEGIDIPPVNQILFWRSTNSKRIFLQELGRGMRRTPRKKRVQALDFVANAERLLVADKIWSEIANYVGIRDPFEEDIHEIDLNTISFSETAVNALRLLRTIDKKIYRPDQTVPAGAMLGSRLERELRASRGAVKAIASALGIQPQVFPRNSGSKVPFYTAKDADRIRQQHQRMFPGKKK